MFWPKHQFAWWLAEAEIPKLISSIDCLLADAFKTTWWAEDLLCASVTGSSKGICEPAFYGFLYMLLLLPGSVWLSEFCSLLLGPVGLLLFCLDNVYYCRLWWGYRFACMAVMVFWCQQRALHSGPWQHTFVFLCMSRCFLTATMKSMQAIYMHFQMLSGLVLPCSGLNQFQSVFHFILDWFDHTATTKITAKN